MNLTQIKKKLVIYMILAAIIIFILVAFLILSSRKTENNQTQQTPTVKTIPPKEDVQKLPPDIKKIRQEIISKQMENQGGDIILYKTDSLEIAYVPTPDIFFVNIKKEPVDTFKNRGSEWFLGFGLKPDDLCTLPVRFTTDFSLKKSHPDFNPLPDGC